MRHQANKKLYNYWDSLRGNRTAPERREIDPTQIRSALANTFILEAGDHDQFNFRLAGSHICSTYCRELKSRSFNKLWHEKDNDAVETLIKAVTQDHAVALIGFMGSTQQGHSEQFECLLLPLRHNGATNNRILGALSAMDTPYWLGMKPILEQRITSLRLIWPDEANHAKFAPEQLDSDAMAFGRRESDVLSPINLDDARRYAHLSVIDGGKTH